MMNTKERDVSPTFLPRVDQAAQPFNRHFNVASPVSGDRSQEDLARQMLEDLKAGRITVSSLMGPLYGEMNLTS